MPSEHHAPYPLAAVASASCSWPLVIVFKRIRNQALYDHFYRLRPLSFSTFTSLVANRHPSIHGLHHLIRMGIVPAIAHKGVEQFQELGLQPPTAGLLGGTTGAIVGAALIQVPLAIEHNVRNSVPMLKHYELHSKRLLMYSFATLQRSLPRDSVAWAAFAVIRNYQKPHQAKDHKRSIEDDAKLAAGSTAAWILASQPQQRCLDFARISGKQTTVLKQLMEGTIAKGLGARFLLCGPKFFVMLATLSSVVSLSEEQKKAGSEGSSFSLR